MIRHGLLMEGIPLFVVAAALLGASSCAFAAGTDLRVSANGRYLEYKSNGAPFYWIGDTPWGLFARINRQDAELYLNNRQAKGITVIQAVAHWPWSAGGSQLGPQQNNTTNVYGHRIFNGTAADPNTASPLVVSGGTPDSPNDYWDHVDFIVRETRERGMHLAFVPAWGRYFINVTGSAYQYTEAEARAYGEFLGARYRNEPHIIWVLGGDREPVYPSGVDRRPVYRAMAEGIVKGVSGQTVAWNQSSPAWDTVMMTYHPPNIQVVDFHSDPWLDFEMVQTGQTAPNNVVPYIGAYYGRTPVKPVVLAESLYEGMIFWASTYDGNSPVEVRRSIYQSLFCGAKGYTYGTENSTLTSYDMVWGFGSGAAWKNRLDIEAAMDIPHVNALLTPRKWHKHAPDQSIITSGAGSSAALQKRASKSSDGDEILVYYPNNTSAQIKNTLASQANARWFDPRNGAFQSAGAFTAGQTRSLQPPSGWEDAVLVIEAVSGGGGEIIVDNADGVGVTILGSWGTSSASGGYYGPNYLHDDNAGGGKSVTFTPTFPAFGTYEVFARWTSHANRASNASIDVNHAGGTAFLQVNQRTGGGQWVSLGAYNFVAGSSGSVKIHNTGANGYVIADAVRFVRQTPVEIILDSEGSAGITFTGTWASSASTGGYLGSNYLHNDNTGQGTKSVRFTPSLPSAGNYEVFARWTAYTNRASNVPIDIVRSGGTTTVTVDQRTNGGQWRSLGTHSFNTTGGSVLIRTTGTTGYVVVDAIRLVRR